MISRSKDKCDEKLQEIRDKYHDVETISYGCDFSKITTLAEYRDLVKQSGLMDVDIAILALNAGLQARGHLDLIDDQPYQDIWSVNFFHVVYLLKALTDKLLSRDKRCAILITSSISASIQMPGIAAYPATKAAVSNFGEAIHYDLQKNVDVTVWEPGFIKTKILVSPTPSSMMLTTE